MLGATHKLAFYNVGWQSTSKKHNAPWLAGEVTDIVSDKNVDAQPALNITEPTPVAAMPNNPPPMVPRSPAEQAASTHSGEQPGSSSGYSSALVLMPAATVLQSSAPKGSVAKSSAAQPASNIKCDVFTPLLAQCVKDGPTYTVPTTQHDDRFLRISAPLLARIRDDVVSAVATFYLDEPDPNEGDKPGLDILFAMRDGSWMRYHPTAEPIWSHQALPTVAMTRRNNRARKLARQRLQC